MSEQPLRVLLVDDDSSLCESRAAYLRRVCGYVVETIANGEEALACIDRTRGRYDVALIDDTPTPRRDPELESGGITLLRQIKARYPDIECILFTREGTGSERTALQAGAYRYIRTPFDHEELAVMIEHVATYRQLKGEVGEKRILERLMETSAALLSGRDLQNVLDTICRAAFDLFDVDHSGLMLCDFPWEQGEVVAEYPPDAMTRHTFIPIRGIALEEQLIASKEPLVIDDVTAYADSLRPVLDIFQRFHIRSILIVPIVSKGRVLGSFSLDAVDRVRAFSAEEIALCKIFAAQAAAALENAQLLMKLRGRADRLEMLRKTTLAISAQLDPETLLKIIIQQAIRLLGAKSGYIDKCDLVPNVLSLPATALQPEHTPGLAGGDTEHDVRQPARPGPAAIAHGRHLADAAIEAPLKWQNRTIGVLRVGDDPGREFTAEDRSLLQLFADHAAIALANADLAARDVAKVRRLERLAQISSEIMGNLDDFPLDERLTLIAKYATEILHAESCGIFLVKRPGYLSLEASYGHREGGFKKGQHFAIRSGRRTDLTGYIAAEGKLFNLHGPALTEHFAVKGLEARHIASPRCCSLLAIPLKKRNGQKEELIGLLRTDNKKGSDGQAGPGIGFSQEDEWILKLFADAAVAAIEGAGLVTQLIEQKDYQHRLIASSPNGVIAIDRKGNVTAFSARAQEVLNYRLKEVRGKPVDRLYDDPKEPRRIGQLLHTTQDGKLAGYETFVRSKEGESIPIRLTATWLYDARGKRIGSAGYFEDLRSIKETERRLELLLKASNIVAQAEHLTDGLQHLAEMMVTFLNITFCRIFLLDESKEYLVAKAVFPIARSSGQFAWRPGVGDRTAVADWPGLTELLEEGGPTVFKMSGARGRLVLAEWSQRLDLKHEIQSLLIIPLRTRDRIVGLLDLGELRRWERSPFSKEKQDLAAAIADQTAVLIDRMRLYESTERRRHLLETLDAASRHIRAEKEPARLLQEIVRLAAELVGCMASGLYVNRPQLQELELRAIYGLPEELIGRHQPHAEGLAGLVAWTGQPRMIPNYDNWPERETILDAYHFTTVAGVPLKQAGEVEAVLFVADPAGRPPFLEHNLEILERFAAQASIALQTSRLIGREQRAFGQLKILHKISDYIEVAGDLDKILHVVLTGVTAGYGLGFNRAALLLLDERGEQLEGRMGIGHLVQPDAQEDWNRHHRRHMEDFQSYLDLLQHMSLPLTPLGERIRGLRLLVSHTTHDILSRVVLERRWTLVTPENLDALPRQFAVAFEPGGPLVVAPLMTRDQVIGLLVADNKFTRAPITDESVEALLTFVNTAAIAIDNTQLLQATRTAQGQFRAFSEASNALVSSRNPAEVLQETVERACAAAGASGVSMILIDALGQVCDLTTAGNDRLADIADVTRPNGLSMQVLRTGEPEVIEDTLKQRERINPSMIRRGIRAALCFPFSLEGDRIGVMWFHYDHPRHFSPSEVQAIQIYVNQAAIAYDGARRIKELEYMRTAADALAGVAELREVLKQIAQSARELLQADAAIIWSYDAVRARFAPKNSVAAGVSAELWEELQHEAPRPDGAAFTVMERQWVAVQDVNDLQYERFLGPSTRKLLERSGTQSFQGIALSVGDERLAVLYVYYNRRRGFSAREQQTAQTFANHVALALKRAMLLDQVSKVRNTAKVVAEVTALEDLDRTLHSVADGVREVVSCDAVTVYTYDRDKGRLSHLPTTIGVHYEEMVHYLPEVTSNSLVFEMLRRDRMYVVENIAADPLFHNSRFAADERVKSCAAIPLKVGAEKVGVMFINYRRSHRFTDDELTNLDLFANQAAVAIRNAQLYQQVNERLDEWRALQQIAASLVGRLELQELLKLVLVGAMQLTNTDSSCIVFWDARTEKFGMTLTVTRNGNSEMRQSRVRDHDITWSIIHEHQPVIIHDTRLDDRVNAIVTEMGRRSMAGVPLLHYSEVIGVLYVSSSNPLQFSERQVALLETFASQAAVAIDRSRHYEELKQTYEELKQTKGLVGARTALAWMGMLSSTWRHAIEGHAINIIDELDLLRSNRDNQALVYAIDEALSKIERLARKIQEKPITPPLFDEDTVVSLSVNDLLRERLRQLEMDESIHCEFIPASDDRVTVRISPEWLRRVFDILIDNAIKAMDTSVIKCITVSVTIDDGELSIAVSDTGCGIPADVLPRLFQEQIPKSKGDIGLGLGLMMTQMIVQTYRGKMQVESPGPGGTTVVIQLPIEA